MNYKKLLIIALVIGGDQLFAPENQGRLSRLQKNIGAQSSSVTHAFSLQTESFESSDVINFEQQYTSLPSNQLRVMNPDPELKIQYEKLQQEYKEASTELRKQDLIKQLSSVAALIQTPQADCQTPIKDLIEVYERTGEWIDSTTPGCSPTTDKEVRSLPAASMLDLVSPSFDDNQEGVVELAHNTELLELYQQLDRKW